MTITGLCNVLAEIKRLEGDLEVYCGRAKIRGFAIYATTPEAPGARPGEKIVSIIAYYEQQPIVPVA